MHTGWRGSTDFCPKSQGGGGGSRLSGRNCLWRSPILGFIAFLLTSLWNLPGGPMFTPLHLHPPVCIYEMPISWKMHFFWSIIHRLIVLSLSWSSFPKENDWRIIEYFQSDKWEWSPSKKKRLVCHLAMSASDG